MRRYIEIYSIMLRNSLIREMSFKANFLLWMVVEILWFCGQIVFFSIIFGNVDHIGDWTKWEVVLLVGTHQIIAQLFQAFFFVNVANIPELVRTGRLDSLLVLPILFQIIFGWIIPVVIVANIPAKLLIKSFGQPFPLVFQLIVASTIIFCLSRVFWRFALRHYSSASS